MDFTHVEPIVRAVLYEGYILYPYRASVKNQYRWTFGGLYPRAWSDANEGDPSWARAETLLVGTVRSALAISVRFLQLVHRDATTSQPEWQEAIERRVDLPLRPLGELTTRPIERPFRFEGDAGDGRTRVELEGALHVLATPVGGSAFRISVTVRNEISLGDGARERSDALLRSFASAHVLLGTLGGEFASFIDPPASLRAAGDGCANVGLWPVLAGPRGRRDVVLASPINLGDHPAVAPESPGDLFDGTEIDEILTLRILTLTDAEKAEMRAVDPRARALLDRAEALGPDALLALHGKLRDVRGLDRDPLRPGSRVRLRPVGRADAFDLVLAGREATIDSIERDFEGRVFVAVTIDDDPGRDLGLVGQPGHRFFFRSEEVEPLS